MSEWSDFFVAEAGASAALAGLVFVGVSINIEKIVAFPHLPLRAAEALALLMSVLVVSTLLLAPGQSTRTTGVELLAVGAADWLLVATLGAARLRRTPEPYRRAAWPAVAAAHTAPASLTIAGTAVLWQGADGLYWLLPGFVGAFVVAIADAWVLLIEVNR